MSRGRACKWNVFGEETRHGRKGGRSKIEKKMEIV